MRNYQRSHEPAYSGGLTIRCCLLKANEETLEPQAVSEMTVYCLKLSDVGCRLSVVCVGKKGRVRSVEIDIGLRLKNTTKATTEDRLDEE
ncbi:unnamed protein product [Ceratitis capitata]|uniref:(Mediterranean fruit fly) hypothetical protein n=1 Tax=Ceratitis capitata TaxID=7213 RepID=A0A811V4D1_CERCA|nr:unnamed protein product [Ceratitis capitata]